MNTKKQLNAEQLEQAGGGFVVADESQGKYWAVRQNGTILAPAPSEEKAIEYAKSYNVSPKVMTLEEYKEHFGRDFTW